MRILLRTCIILAAALAVAGATFGLVQSGAVSAVPRGARPVDRLIQGAAGQQAAPAGQQAAQGGARPGGGREGRGGFSLFGLAELLRGFLVIAVIVALTGLAGRIRRRRGAAEPPSAPEASSF